MKSRSTLKSTETFGKIAEETLRAILADVPSLSVGKRSLDRKASDLGIDAMFQLKDGSSRRIFVIEVKSTGQARDAQTAASVLARYTKDKKDVYGIFYAPYISESAAKLCAELGFGFFDLSGNCRIAFDGIYIRTRSDVRRSKVAKKTARSLYSPKSERVLRVLLSDVKRSWKVAELAKEAGISLGQTSNLRRALAEQDLIRISPDGIQISDPERLLKDWAQWSSQRRQIVHRYHSLDPLPKIERALAGKGGADCVLTQFSAASRVAPGGIRYSRAAAYVRDDPSAIASGLGLKLVDSGANVLLIEPYDEGLFQNSQTVDGVEVVSTAQCYLDLRPVSGRGEEAAETVLMKMKADW